MRRIEIRRTYFHLDGRFLSLGMSVLLLPLLAAADPRSQPAPPAEGEVIHHADIERLRPFLPPEFWAHRDIFFYEGMRMTIGPAFRDYSPAQIYVDATERHRGEARVSEGGALIGYTAGQPFPMDAVDCASDPQAGVKVMWNLDYSWKGTGMQTSFLCTYWDRGERLPLYYEGSGFAVQLAHRAEPRYLARGGDRFRRDKRKSASRVHISNPHEARGIRMQTYRYKSSDGELADAQKDDMWVYVPTLRRVRRISTAQRSDSMSGTDFTFEDLNGFDGVVPQYDWQCLGEMELMAPVNTRVLGFPYRRDHAFGPYGLSFADDDWELRRAIKVRMTPKNEDHPYAYKDIYIDRETMNALYAFAYDRKGELWKIIWHNERWSEDHLEGESWYPAWESVPEPRDLRIVGDVIVNVQTGTGNRIEFWDNSGEPFASDGKLRRAIGLGGLEGR